MLNMYITDSHCWLLSCSRVFTVRGYVLCTIVTPNLWRVFTEFGGFRWFLTEFKLGADTTLSGNEFHKSTTWRLKNHV